MFYCYNIIYKSKYNNSSEYPSNLYDVTFDYFIFKLFKKYDNFNILLTRNDQIYDKNGRFQNLEESKEIDKEIKNNLIIHDIPFVEFNVNNNTYIDIYEYMISNNI